MTEVEIQLLLFISALAGVKLPSLRPREFTFEGIVLSSCLLTGPLRKTGRSWEGDNFLSCRQLNSCPSLVQHLLRHYTDSVLPVRNYDTYNITNFLSHK